MRITLTRHCRRKTNVSKYETLDRKTVCALADSMPAGDSLTEVLEWLWAHPEADSIKVCLDSLGRLEAINE